MENIDFQKFKNEVEKLKKEKKITKKMISVALGYKSQNAFSNVLQGITKLTPEIVRKFCKIYHIDINDIIIENEDLIIEQTMADINTIKSRLSNIENQIDIIHKTNSMMKQLYISGVELTDSQLKNIKTLRALIGN